MNLTHRFLGAVIFNEDCQTITKAQDDPTIIVVIHEEAYKAVSRALIQETILDDGTFEVKE